MQHPELGRKILDEVSERMEDIAIQAYPQLDGRNMTMILSPDKKAIEKHSKGKSLSKIANLCN